MAKTKWIIEPSTVTIYPKRNLRIIGLVFLVLVAGFICYLSNQAGSYSNGLTLGYYGFLLLIPLLLFFMAESKIIFNGTDRKLFKQIGFLRIGSIPFDDIASIDAYETMGSISYRLFKKSNRYGKGLALSGSYNKATNVNLIQFQNEVLAKVDELVFANAPLIPKQTIYDFEFFKEEGSIYVLRQNKIGGSIVGIAMVFATIAMLRSPDFLAGQTPVARVLLPFFPLAIGLAFFYMVFSSLKFDKNQQKLMHYTFGGLRIKEYTFENIIRFQIIRKTTNLIYSGTEVNAEIFLPEKNKMKAMSMKSFMGTKKIDRFLEEVNTILGRV